jgi:putative DNA methylase
MLVDGAEEAYAEAIATYLALGVSKLADYNSSFAVWSPTRDQAKSTFARQALPMVWDYAEVNPFAMAAGDLDVTLAGISEVLESSVGGETATVTQFDATSMVAAPLPSVVCTDPPYYDNVSYAALGDFFYVWLRRSIGTLYPRLFATVLTPKSGELVADPQRSGGDPAAAEAAFEKGFERAFRFLAARCRVDVPMAVFYAFKQTEESDEDGVASTGWETMLAALIRAGFGITGTWPIRTERFGRTNSLETNALASSIVLVCRLRPSDAGITDRRGFITALRSQLPSALRELQAANIAPVDLAQAAIGPGMAVFSRYARVVEADGSAMRVRTALGLINQALDEVLSEQEGEFDPDTRWAVAWFEQNGFQPGRFGDAETLSKAKVTSIDRLAEAGIVSSRSGVVRLLHREELDVRRGPDARDASIWALTQRLIHALESDSEAATARLLAEAGGQSEAARDLAYRLFVSAERRGWAADALSFNALVTAWPELTRLAAAQRGPVQETML